MQKTLTITRDAQKQSATFKGEPLETGDTVALQHFTNYLHSRKKPADLQTALITDAPDEAGQFSLL